MRIRAFDFVYPDRQIVVGQSMNLPRTCWIPVSFSRRNNISCNLYKPLNSGVQKLSIIFLRYKQFVLHSARTFEEIGTDFRTPHQIFFNHVRYVCVCVCVLNLIIQTLVSVYFSLHCLCRFGLREKNRKHYQKSFIYQEVSRLTVCLLFFILSTKSYLVYILISRGGHYIYEHFFLLLQAIFFITFMLVTVHPIFINKLATYHIIPIFSKNVKIKLHEKLYKQCDSWKI